MGVHPDHIFSDTTIGWPGKWIITSPVTTPADRYDLRILDVTVESFSSVFGNDLQKLQNFIFIHYDTSADSPQISINQEQERLVIGFSLSVRNKPRSYIKEILIRKIQELDLHLSDFVKPAIETKSAFPGIPQRVAILYLAEQNDTRWKKMGTPVAPMILAELTRKSGHIPFIIPVHSAMTELSLPENPDIIAIGIYEDLFDEVKSLLSRLRLKYDATFVAGGPLVTLAPRMVAAHLPEVDIILRGEVEGTFPLLLNLHAESRNRKQPIGSFLHLVSDIPGIFIRDSFRMIFNDFDVSPVSDSDQLLHIAYDFEDLIPFQLSNGLELSTSRGCPRSCCFCSHVHGRKLRKASLEGLTKILMNYQEHLRNIPEVKTDNRFAVNINDDDLLIQPDRCLELLDILQLMGFTIWGIQTSLSALKSVYVQENLLKRLSEPSLYHTRQPLLWIGTDAFVSSRIKRIGKSGSFEDIVSICHALQEHGILGCHYWIVTDAESDWSDFIQELIHMSYLAESYPDTFRVLPNAATLIPYPSTPIYAKRLDQQRFDRIITKRIVSIPGFPEFDYPLIRHERPCSPYLYAFVEPRAEVPERLLFPRWDFIMLIRENQFETALGAAIHTLNQEIRDIQHRNPSEADRLKKIRDRIFETEKMRFDADKHHPPTSIVRI